MKNLKDIIQEKLKIGKTSFVLEKLKINSNTKITKIEYQPKTVAELTKILVDIYNENGNDGDYNSIDVSHLKNLNFAFDNNVLKENFNGDLSKWDVSNIKVMVNTFDDCVKFEGKGLENWDVSKVETFSGCFYGCKNLNIDNIDNWGTKKKDNADMTVMFAKVDNPPKWYQSTY